MPQRLLSPPTSRWLVARDESGTRSRRTLHRVHQAPAARLDSTQVRLADTRHPEGASVYWDEHELEHPQRKALLSVPSWDWAERDGNTLVWSEKGILYRAIVNKDGPASAKMLYDFNPMQFESRKAPYDMS